MSSIKKLVFVTVISVFFFLLGNRVFFIAGPQAIAHQPAQPMTIDVTREPLRNLQPLFPKIPLKLQPPITGGQDLDDAFMRRWLSDRSPEIFLTFDDGPSPQATSVILDLLKQHDIKATFFVLGRNALRFPEIVRRLVAEGHELALHAQTHTDLLTLTRDQKEAEIARSLSLLHWYFPDLRIRWFRPPYGNYDQEVVDIAHHYGMCVAMFNEISTDSSSSAAEIAQVVLTGQGKIIVFHDGQWPRPSPLTEAESRLIEGLANSVGQVKAQGARFMTLSGQFDRFCP